MELLEIRNPEVCKSAGRNTWRLLPPGRLQMSRSCMTSTCREQQGETALEDAQFLFLMGFWGVCWSLWGCLPLTGDLGEAGRPLGVILQQGLITGERLYQAHEVGQRHVLSVPHTLLPEMDVLQQIQVFIE